MQDFLHIPNSKDNIRTFYATGSAGWEVWSKPSNAKFISIFCLGGGGGGGAGYSNLPNTATVAGGGSGASSGYTRAIYPVSVLPDILYVQVGAGGPGGLAQATTGQNGTAGGNSYVSLAPSITAVNLLAAANTNAPGGGGGSSITSGAAGTVPTIWVLTSSPFTVLGIVQPVVGLVGVGTANGVAGTSTTALNTGIISQSASGAGKISNTTALAGGSVNAAPVLLVNTVNGGAAGGGDGNSGYGFFAPFCSVGGAGGGSTVTAGATAGRGGDGWYGSGGGGGGSGPIAGRGGKGGDGLVIITTIF